MEVLLPAGLHPLIRKIRRILSCAHQKSTLSVPFSLEQFGCASYLMKSDTNLTRLSNL